MTTIPIIDITSNARTEGEGKAFLDELRDAATELPGGGVETELTISAGSVTPTSWFHTIDTELDAGTDDLDNILTTNHPAGRLICIRVQDAGRDVVVKHAATGAGQVFLADAADFTMSTITMFLYLRRVGADWNEVMRFYGNDSDAFALFHKVAGLTTANVFTKTQTWTKGADLTSAGPLVIGADGNYFDVTGAVGFAAMTVGAGLLFMLQFDGVLTMTDGASIDLAGANITTAAGDRAIFFSTAANVVQLMAYQVEGQPPYAIATQAEMEAATSTVKAVTPGRQKFHPSAAKAWIKGSYSAGVPQDDASYNVTSLDDDGIGLIGVNFTTAMSTANYAAGASSPFASGGDETGPINLLVGSFDIRIDHAAGGSQDRDFCGWALGDQ